MPIAILFSKVMGKRKTKIQLKFHFQCSRKTENENTSWNSIFNVLGKRKTKMESRIPFSSGVGKRKTKVQVRIPFSHFVGKRLALRYTHSNPEQNHGTRKWPTWVRWSICRFRWALMKTIETHCDWAPSIGNQTIWENFTCKGPHRSDSTNRILNFLATELLVSPNLILWIFPG